MEIINFALVSYLNKINNINTRNYISLVSDGRTDTTST